MDKVQERIALLAEVTMKFEELEKKGTLFFVDNEETTAKEVAKLAVCEDSPYMRDYIWGESGDIDQIRFDRVNKK